MTKADDVARLEASSYPLIVYVHAPKTGGSTIKRILDSCSPRGHHSIETIIDDRASCLDLARSSDWISGHIPRDSLANSLIWLDRPIEYFASVREPVAQLVSHLNFSFERYSRSNYYVELSLEEQQRDAKVMSTDFSNPAAVIDLLFQHAYLYLNIQSRLLLGADFAEISDDEIGRRLATYKYVSSASDLPRLYRAFGFAQLPEGVNEIRENVATPHINTQIFDSPQLREFLAQHHQRDLHLYATVRGASWPAEGRHPFRPAFMALEVFTAENFDEQTYLDSNADVAAAVSGGFIESGRAHFESYGHKENRMVRRWVLPPAEGSEQKSPGTDFSASSALERLQGLREEHSRIGAEFQSRQRQLAATATISNVADL
jgi:hypothetical protein